ncbi:MAG: DUF4242 domain-containing protein [Rhodanobacteraceae bacterium]
MPFFVIERDIPGAGQMNREDLQAAIRNSVATLDELGPDIQWIHSFVTDDKVYCIYMAPDESLIREHARQAGMPADRVSAVRSLLKTDGVHLPDELLARENA